MVSTGQEPQINDQEQASRIAQPPKTHQQWHALNILVLLILLGMFLLSFSHEVDYESGIQRINFSLGGQPPVSVLEMRPGARETHFVAIVVHGVAGSKDLMSTFGTELAHAGITTYLLDLPGHGESTAAAQLETTGNFKENANVAALHTLITNVRTRKILPTPTPTINGTATPRPQNSATATAKAQNTPGNQTPEAQSTPTPPPSPPATSNTSPKIILIGYAMGATMVSNYLNAYQKENDDIISTVLISPESSTSFTATFPHNLLLLAGQHEEDEILNNTTRIFNIACARPANQAVTQSRECGKVDEDKGRRITFLSGLDHTTVLTSNLTFQETLNWLHRVEPGVTDTNIHADSRLIGLALGVLSIILAIFPLCSLLIDIFSIRATVRATGGIELVLFFLSLVIGIGVALAVQWIWRPLGFIHIIASDYVTGYFFLIAVIMILFLTLTRRRLPLPPFKQVPQQILAGFIPAALLYLTLGQLMTFAWQRVTLNWPRLLDFVIIGILILPLFLLEEGIIRGYQSKNVLHTVIADVVFKALLMGGLFIAPWLSNEPHLDFLNMLIPVLALLLIILAGICTQFYHSGRAALAGAIFSTLIVAWCLATIFPLS